MADTKPPTQGAASGTQVDWRTLHIWEIQPVRDGLVLLLVLGLIYLGYVLSVVTVPILLAMTLAYLFEPLVRRITRDGAGWINRQTAALGIIAAVVVLVSVPLVVGVGYGLLQGISVAQKVAANVQTVMGSIEEPESPEKTEAVSRLGPRWIDLRERIVHLKADAERSRNAAASGGSAGTVEPPDVLAMQLYGAVEWVQDWVKRNSAQLRTTAIQTGAEAVQVVFRFVVSMGFLVFSAFLTAFFFFFFCTGWGRVLQFWKGLIPERRRAPAIELVQKMDQVIAGFVRGRLTICGIFVLYFTLCYWMIGAPVPLIIGPLIGLLCIVPYAATAGLLVAIVLMWLDPGSSGFRAYWWWIIGAPVLVHSIGQLLDDYVLTPAIQGRSTNMDTPTILFASLAGGVLGGFYGLLLAIPVAACLKILLKDVFWPRFRAWAEGRASDPLPIGRR